jgi:hypothetical protein
MPEDRELDQLIDSALSTYAEPRTGLEASVLANLAADTSKPEPTRRRWLPWAIALPIAACIVLMLMLYPRHDRTEPIRQAQREPALHTQATPENSIAQAAQIPEHKPRPRVVASHTTHTAPATLPKLDVFPTPRPLSSEEQALVHFVATAPASERNAALAAQQQVDEPLHIAEITIQPLALEKPETEPNR